MRVAGNEIRILQQVTFARDSAEVAPAAAPILDDVVRALQSQPSVSVEIEGHAGAGEKEPWILAAQRAGAVRAALTARGVRGPLAVRSFGDTRPVAEGITEDARRRNRRVEFHVVPRAGEEADARREGGFRSAVQGSGGGGAATSEVAGAVRYDITDPVTIVKHSSNLVTIVNRYVPGEEVLLYRPDPNVPSSSTHPFRAARLDNHDGLELQPGSVAVYAGGTFVGEGLLGHLNPGERTLIPYAVDGATEVRSTVRETQKPLRILAIGRGMLTVEDADAIETRYDADVGQQPPARLVVRHPRHSGYEANDLPPGTETSPEAYVVPLPVRAGTTTVLELVERRTVRREINVVDVAAASLNLYLQGSGLAPDLDKKVRDLLALREDIVKRDAEFASVREVLTDAGIRAGELRESLRAVEKTPRAAGIQKELLQRLGEATKTIEGEAAQLADKTTAQSLAKGRLGEAVRTLRLGETGAAARTP